MSPAVLNCACCCSSPLAVLADHRVQFRAIKSFPLRDPGSINRRRCLVSAKASSSTNSTTIGPKPPSGRDFWLADWVSSNDSVVRGLPIFVGSASLLAVLLNRALSGIAPVADASSSQSRADILTLALAVTNILSGLVWLSIRPKYISPVEPSGLQCMRLHIDLPGFAIKELLWVWDSLSKATCCRSLVIVRAAICLLQMGAAAESSSETGDVVAVDALKLIQGSLYKQVQKSGKQTYLANLSLYPGRSELSFLPSNTQAVILQPLNDGIAIIGGDTIRGFSNLDQAWISSISDKMDATLSNM